MKLFSLCLLVLLRTIFGTDYSKLYKPHPDESKSSIRGIDAIYVINLDFRPERWHRIEPILHFHNIAASRFSAVFGWEFTEEQIKEFCTPALKPGQLGCMMSHLSIYKDAIDKDLEIIWILEDDFEVLRSPQALSELIEELNQIDPEWDILYTDLDFIDTNGQPMKSLASPDYKKEPLSFPLSYYTYRENLSKNIQLIRQRFGTTSMVISKRGMHKIINHYQNYEDILSAIDIELHYIKDIKQYGAIDPIITNAHFCFNYSDCISSNLFYFYEINNENKTFLQSLINKIVKLDSKWSEIWKEKNYQ